MASNSIWKGVRLYCDSCSHTTVVQEHVESMGCPMCGKEKGGGWVENQGKKAFRPGWEGGWMYRRETSES